MEYKEFKKYASSFNVIPVYRKITGDMLTPVLTYLNLREKDKFCFLLESVDGIGRLARYSFIGRGPEMIISNRGRELTINRKGETITKDESIFDYLQNLNGSYRKPEVSNLPDFTGGIVGYLGYENIALIEDVLEFRNSEDIDTPDSIFGLFNTVIAFDHYKHQLMVISNVHIDDNTDPEAAYKEAVRVIDETIDEIRKPAGEPEKFESDFRELGDEGKDDYCRSVEESKKNIVEGDIFQIVLSKRFGTGYSGDLINVYRALRIINPSPYMYILEFADDFTVIGTSPEDLLKVINRKATILPIAGTRKRGGTDEEDRALEQDLLADPKEIAEHVMLVDLARNDLGRVSDFGTVEVTEKMNVHYFSHVMHIVSRVEGELKKDKDCIDALKASFPAGTVSGAPKIRAMQLIEDYESVVRNVYAGAIGYMDFGGNLDMCIAIRTLFAKDKKVYWQAGAGIVADSIPENEYEEIKNKASALVNALKFAEVIDENSSD